MNNGDMHFVFSIFLLKNANPAQIREDNENISSRHFRSIVAHVQHRAWASANIAQKQFINGYRDRRRAVVLMQKRDSKKSVVNPSERSPAAKYTNKIEFFGVGANESGDRFIKRRIGQSAALISVAAILENANEEYVRLQRDGVALLQPAARREFIQRVEEESSKEPMFRVAMRPGLLDDKFHFPSDVVSLKGGDAAFYPDSRHSDSYDKFHSAGSREGWDELCGMARGNTRLILGHCLAFSGAPCAAFGLEPPNGQFVGDPGSGKSTAAKIVSATWGWDMRPGALFGFGSPWATTPNALENAAAGQNQTLLYLDEMHKASLAGIEAVMTIAQGQGKARYTEQRRQMWCAPLLSTSNMSVVGIMSKFGLPFDAAYVDRLMDVPLPANKSHFFENLHGCADLPAFESKLRALAEKNHGTAGRVFAKRFAEKLSSNRDKLKASFEATRADYQKAASGIVAKQRDLGRIHGRCATIYAAGCFAARFGVLRFSRQELLEAILTCERDHIAFIDRERGLGVSTNPGSTTATSAPLIQSPYDHLRKFIKANATTNFIDLRDSTSSAINGRQTMGYIGVHRGQKEYWITNQQFDRIAGGVTKGVALKKQLYRMGLLSTEGRGANRCWVVKRNIPGVGNRVRVVAILAPTAKSAAKV
jgi:hypothetical protein